MKTFTMQTSGLPSHTPVAETFSEFRSSLIPARSQRATCVIGKHRNGQRLTVPAALMTAMLVASCGGGGNGDGSEATANEPGREPATTSTPNTESQSPSTSNEPEAAGSSPTTDASGTDSSNGSTSASGLESDQGTEAGASAKRSAPVAGSTSGSGSGSDSQSASGGESGSEQEVSASSQKEITDPSAPGSAASKSGSSDSDIKAEIEQEKAVARQEKTGGGQKEATTARSTSFKSNNTPGFGAKLLADGTVVVSWAKDPEARGYNVYRQAEYLTTVFTNEYRHPKAPEGSYYYEIEAFKPPNDARYRVAKGLTVDVGNAQLKRKPYDGLPSMLTPDYQLAFSDEFNGSSLDESKWSTRFLWGPDKTINNEVQYYVDTLNKPQFGYDPFLFDGQHLTIRGVPTPSHLKAKANNKPYLSGIITSYDSFKFTYGYAEVRAKMPFGRGLWPAFWLLNAYYNDRRPEIDIMEFIGHDQDAAHHTYHYFDYNDKLRSTKLYPTVGMDFTHDFHTFGALWKPGTIIFYVDGVQRKRVDDSNVSHEQMYVLLNLAMGGWWAGDPSDKTPFPADYVIDYVRVYQGNMQNDDTILSDGAGFDGDAGSTIPEAADSLGSTPNHLPDREDWPEGYPY